MYFDTRRRRNKKGPIHTSVSQVNPSSSAGRNVLLLFLQAVRTRRLRVPLVRLEDVIVFGVGVIMMFYCVFALCFGSAELGFKGKTLTKDKTRQVREKKTPGPPPAMFQSPYKRLQTMTGAIRCQPAIHHLPIPDRW